MTAIIGFTDRSNFESRLGILVADNLEFYSNAKQDKIILLGNRFAIAVTGIDLLMNCLALLKCFENFTSPSFPATVEELVEQVGEIVGHFIPQHFKRVLPKISPERLAMLKMHQSVLVVLDVKEGNLYCVDVGYIIPPDRISKPFWIRPLADGQIYRFGAAFSHPFVAEPPKTNNPLQEMKDLIDDAHRRHPDKVGSVGAYVVVKNSNLEEFVSTYRSVPEAIDEYFKEQDKLSL